MAALYVFDAYGTLFDVHSAVARHHGRIGPEAARLSELWRLKQLEYSWVRTLAGAPYLDFRALTEQALDVALSRHPVADAAVRSDLLSAYERLDPYPDVAPALARLRAAGARLAILSNGSRAMLASALEAGGLREAFDAVISVDEIGRYKADQAVYALVGERFGIAAGETSFQSSNRWDIAGAHLAGFRTVWVNRVGAPDEYVDQPPDRVVGSLAEL